MSPGEVLAAARGERGLTLRNASAATRIRAESLCALEAGDLNALPPAVYAAGFISIDGRDLGPLGAGVATKDVTSQTAT